MKINLKNGKSASKIDVELLQEKVGGELDKELLVFLSKYDGAEPESNKFMVGETNDSGVNEFFPVKRIISEMKHIENLPKHAFPIAWAEGGNYVFVDLSREGAVFFWDHEQPDIEYSLAKKFCGFLETMEPFDLNSIKLMPGQVLEVWKAPGSDEEFKDYLIKDDE